MRKFRTLIQELHQAGSTNGLRLDSVAPLQPENDGPIQKTAVSDFHHRQILTDQPILPVM